MESVIVSRRFQVVIPKSIRQSLGLKPGTRVQVMLYGERIEIVPLRKTKAMRGLVKGIDTDVPREQDRI
jgi:AbrB family looped-hinge helix DNA binding protein